MSVPGVKRLRLHKTLGKQIEALHRVRQPQARLQADPIEMPRRYRDPLDIEVVGLLSATLAYGRVGLFKPVVEKILSLCGGSPFRYVATFDAKRERPRFKGLYYRFNRSEDFVSFLDRMGQVIRQHDSLGRCFLSHYREADEDIGPALSGFIAALHAARPDALSRGLAYMLPSPEAGSACKRLNLYLRWMIRPDDGIDFGFWKAIPSSKLIIPLDTHVIRIAAYLGLSRRKSPDWKMAKEITEALKRFDPADPVKYDFALCHLGISGDCPLQADPEKCEACLLREGCRRGRRALRRIAS